MNKLLMSAAIITCSSLGLALQAGDNFHFYRAGYFVGEPRLEKKGLSTIDITAGAGSTCQGRAGDCSGLTTSLLNIYGKHNMHIAGEGVPNKDMSDPVDITLTNLALIPARDCFGELLFTGKFSIKEAYVWATQNFNYGIFFQAILPIRSLEISNVCFNDCSPTDEECPNRETLVWQTFLNLFDETLAKYNVKAGSTKSQGVGDLALLLGWAYNYQETEVLDYIDVDIKTGVLVPTGKVKQENQAFSLPTGYDGHVGIPIQIDTSCGVYDWLTFGANAGAILFLDEKKPCLHMKTNCNQSGFIKLASGPACVSKGNLWYLGAYAKADHVCRGLSFLFGYSFVRENGTTITPDHSDIFIESIVNSDAMFKEWQMHTLNFIIDYDFTKAYMKYGPHIGAFYNKQISGKRTFDTSVGGGMFGVDIAWHFD